jgi:aspartyl-tRNA(Asn)/glutamyl-tRNA(Gln) amidotransferase subunit B
MKFEAVVGLEIHLELNSPTKMFCDCPNRPGDPPNQNTCPICLWLPGAIPQFSLDALERATTVCLALHCELQEWSAFDQKVYYYPDLPKGFQLSQHHRPLSKGGWVDVEDENGEPKRLRLHHIHMEEDVARLVHEVEDGTPISLVDFNRAGAPLVEIVTEPDMRSPHDAMAFLRALRKRVAYTGCAECSMERGTMRADANISIRPRGSDAFNTKVEVKNMNSIRAVGDAIAYEFERQESVLAAGQRVVLHTRLWDPERNVTVAMRGKFAGPCVPDPSVPPVVITQSWIDKISSLLPEMPDEKMTRFVEAYGLTDDEVALLCADRAQAEYFEAAVKGGANPRLAASWLATQLGPQLKQHGQDYADAGVTPERFAGLLLLFERGEINAASAKDVLGRMFETDVSAAEIVAQSGFQQVSDAEELERVAEQVMADNPEAVESYRRGEEKTLSFLIGEAMRVSGGKANPHQLREVLLARLN